MEIKQVWSIYYNCKGWFGEKTQILYISIFKQIVYFQNVSNTSPPQETGRSAFDPQKFLLLGTRVALQRVVVYGFFSESDPLKRGWHLFSTFLKKGLSFMKNVKHELSLTFSNIPCIFDSSNLNSEICWIRNLKLNYEHIIFKTTLQTLWYDIDNRFRMKGAGKSPCEFKPPSSARARTWFSWFLCLGVFISYRLSLLLTT